MIDKRLIILAGSAGAVIPLRNILNSLKPNFKIPIIILLHQKEICTKRISFFSHLMKSRISVPNDYDIISENKIYLAPPMYHLQIEKDYRFSFALDEKVFHSRPSIDVLLETAAYAYSNKLNVFIFSGMSIDGQHGAKIVLKCGGKVYVQKPQEAEYSLMPEAIIDENKDVQILSLEEMIEIINNMEEL